MASRETGESSTHCTVCMFVCIWLVPFQTSDLVFSLLPCGYFMFFTALPSSVFHTFPCAQICGGDAISSVRFRSSCFVLGPYQSRWLTVGRGLTSYLSNLGDKQTHCISNIRNTLERRSENGDARDTVQPQTV